jgi:hypothetical protein
VRRLALQVIWVSMAIGLLAAGGCSAPTAEVQPSATTGPVAEPTEVAISGESGVSGELTPAAAPGGAGTAWAPDGVIADGEYRHDVVIGEVHVWWSNDDEYLYVGMEAATTGWIAVGLDPESAMAGANYSIGAVTQEGAILWDAYGTAPVGATHPPDEDLGGTDDTVVYEGVEEAGVTRFELQIPLDSGDEFDKALTIGGTYGVIAAVGSSDEYSAPHTSRAKGEITLD